MKIWCVAFLMLYSVAAAQAQTTSRLSGVVTDPSGALIPGAEIVLVNSDTNAQRSTLTDEQGRYSFPQLQPGTYRLTGRLAGFREQSIRDIRLLVNTSSEINIR